MTAVAIEPDIIEEAAHELACETGEPLCDGTRGPAEWWMESHCCGVIAVCTPCAEYENQPLLEDHIYRCINCHQMFQTDKSRVIGPIQ